MMRVAVIQSNYIPWKGYFDIIHDVDLFVFYDDVQYTKNDWRNRNRIKSTGGSSWLTIPVSFCSGQNVCDVVLSDKRWQRKHWKSLNQSYSSAPYFKNYRSELECVYMDTEWTNLSALNQYLTRLIAERFLGLTTSFADSRTYELQGSSDARLLDLLTKLKASVYISGPSATNYIQKEEFDKLGIEIVYKDYGGYPEYPQKYPPFDHAVTVLDLLFNCGPKANYYIWGWRAENAEGDGSKRCHECRDHSQSDNGL